MNRLKNVWLIALFLCVVSCNASASTEGGNDAEPAKKEAPAKGEVIVLTKAEFLEKVFNYEKHPNEWVYEGSKPCIVDFYADWCGPCKQVAPILRDLAILYKKDIIVYKINVDQEKELAAAFGIQSIPTFLFTPKEGKPMMSMGALPREDFVKQIDEYLLKKK